MRCPACGVDDDKVVDSRASDDGSAIRRRRQCEACQRRFTTFERLEEAPLLVVKRSGAREPFDRHKVVTGLAAAAKNRPVSTERQSDMAAAIEERLRLECGSEVPSERIGMAVLDELAEVDQVAYVRFASVYKEFGDTADFEREIGLLTKSTAPKRSHP